MRAGGAGGRGARGRRGAAGAAGSPGPRRAAAPAGYSGGAPAAAGELFSVLRARHGAPGRAPPVAGAPGFARRLERGGGGGAADRERLERSLALEAPRDAAPAPSTSAPAALGDSVPFNVALLYGAAALFGTNQLCNKIAVGAHSPASVNMLRFLAASATMLPAMRRGLARDTDPELRRRGLELGAWLLLGYSAQSVGVAHTTAGHAAFTTTFTVLTVPLIAGLRGRRIPASTWAAGAAAVLGVALLDWGGEGLAVSGGDLLCIASAMVFGVHTVRMEEATTRFPDRSQELAALQIAVVALGSVLWEAPELLAVAREGGAAGLAGFAADLPWALGVYMGVATTALTLWMEARAMKVVSAPTAALIYSSEPLWGAGLAFLVLGERWGPTGGAGAALILAASLGSQLAGDAAGGAPPAPGAGAGAAAPEAPHAR